MRMKIQTAIGVFAWSLAIVGGSLPADGVASGLRAEAMDMEMEMNRQPALRASASYGAPVYSTYSRSAANGPDETLSVSVVPEVDSWTMLAAVLGLIGMRLWRSSKKNLLVAE